ncbi:MAG: isopentenyl phosphate kinase [Marine Group I thaumarchaeote]|nr:MAG: Isopentenyl phosphate kinase [Nitrosopumilales archaeon]GFN39496.1 MAG: isopentenyl phosphate kinase [Marine Group I thaumarchaeote]
MILIKLGGSIITNKKKPLTPRYSAINKIAAKLRLVREPLVLVHGGGSFGHYWSVKYGIHTKPSRYKMKGVSTVKNSMVHLNTIVLDSLLGHKLNPYCLPPTDFMRGETPNIKKIQEIKKIAASSLVPVTYGDALWYGKSKSYILSGDKIMSILAKILKPRLCIFVLNVDGLFSDMKTKKLIHHFKTKKISMSHTEKDVTGGMIRKVAEATEISKRGMIVFFVNGNKPDRIVKAISKNYFEGTVFGG